jgi:tetratricopeptide (TPR) repeat protein
VEIARAHGYLDLLTRVARMVRPTFAMSRVSGVLVREALEEVLRIAKEGPNAERVLALSQLACITPYADDLPRSKQLSAEALALARQLGERSSLFEALRSRLYALSGPDDIDELHSVVNEVIQLDQDRPTMKSIEAYSARAGACLYRGDTAAAIQALEAMGSLARQVRLPGPIYYADRQRAQRAFLAGDFSAAQAALPDLDARCARLGLNHAEVFVDVLRTLILIERDGVESLDPEWLNFPRFTFEPPPYVRARQVRGAAELGRRDAGLAGLDAIAAQRFQDLPKDISYLNVLANISLAAVAFSDRERAEQLYALLAPYPHHSTPDPLLFDEGSVSRYLALLAACLGRHEQVEAHFEEALNLNRRMRRRSQVARTLLDYADWRSRERAGARP